jgi:hypothetical protein
MDGVVEISQETLEIDDAGTAVDPIGNAADLDLAGMAGGAIHADFLAIVPAGDGKANRQPGGAAFLVGQITIPAQACRHEGLAVGLLQGSDPA